MKPITILERELRAFGLVSAALGTKAEASKAIEAFTSLVDVDFLTFASHEPAINDVASDRRLKQLQTEMRLYANCPALHSRTIGAIGGGFSSGKSAFVNSLLDASAGVKLAEGITPITAIPSYVLHDQEAVIRGISNKGAAFEIDSEIYKEISHELLKRLPFLRDIMPYIFVSAPMVRDDLEKLCFIDTPGYNPSAVDQAESDPETAREYIKDASFLIWMIGLDTNGTIPLSDLDFLSRLGFGESDARPLYVVASKAELKPRRDVEDIMDVFVECLEDSGMSCAGITAYSSSNREVISTRGQGLFEFLAENNTSREHYTHLVDGLCDVFRPYVEEIYRDNEEKQLFRKAIHGLLIEALRTGNIDIDADDSKLEQGLLELEGKFTHSEKLDIRLKRVEDLFNRFLHCINCFAEEVGMEKRDVSGRISALFMKPGLDFSEPLLPYKKKLTVGSKARGNPSFKATRGKTKKSTVKKAAKKPVTKKVTKKPVAKKAAKGVAKKAVKKSAKKVVKKAKKARFDSWFERINVPVI